MLRTHLTFWHASRDQHSAASYGPVPLACESSVLQTLVLVNGTYKNELIIDTRSDLGTFTL
jgi:hypothetical protein